MKKNPQDYTVIPVKCSREKELFGIRGIRQDGLWHLTWAFKMSERQAKGEHFESNTLSGDAIFDETYPKCPYCGNDTFCTCGVCGCASCVSSRSDGEMVCPWCGTRLKLVESNDITGTKGGGF